MDSFSRIVDLWPTAADLASDLEIPYQTAAAFRQRDSIAPGYWAAIVDAAAVRGYKGVTLARLADLAARAAQAKRKPQDQRPPGSTHPSGESAAAEDLIAGRAEVVEERVRAGASNVTPFERPIP